MRTIFFYLYFFGYLLYSLIPLQEARKLAAGTDRDAASDVAVHRIPKRWAAGLLKIAGADVTVRGLEHMPEGAVLLSANHEGNFDIPVLLGHLEKPFGFISKKEVKKIPIVAKWMMIMPCVFIDRSDRRQAVAAIREGSAMLKQGRSIVIFPEGTRSKGGGVAEFKSGSLRLAKDSGVPIVPVAISGTSAMMEKNGGWIKPAQITVEILPPLLPASYENMQLKDAAAHIREQIVLAKNQ